MRHLLLLAAVCASCGKQGEGDRCDTKNGSADCSAGLVCVKGTELGTEIDDRSAICCPPEDQATVTACIRTRGGGLTDSGSVTEPDSSGGPEGSVDDGGPTASDGDAAPDGGDGSDVLHDAASGD